MSEAALVPAAPFFNPANLEALAGHLHSGLSQKIVVSLQAVKTEAEAQAALQDIANTKIDDERAKLDAKASDA